MKFRNFNTGLGSYEFIQLDTQDTKIFTNINVKYLDQYILAISSTLLSSDDKMITKYATNKPIRLISLFSGGLDITVSTLEVINNFKRTVLKSFLFVQVFLDVNNKIRDLLKLREK